MKVLVAELSQESNSFCPVYTSLDDYKRYGIVSEQDYRNAVRGISIESEGIFTALEEAGISYYPAIRMRAQAGGMILPEVFEHFIGAVDKAIEQEGPFDGAFISFHGATQSTQSDDVCGEAAERIRNMLGKKAVISASFDLHANITRKLFDNVDFICGYHTYPHVDFFETGYRASKLGCDRLLGKNECSMAWCSIPMIEPACGYTTDSGSLGEITNAAMKMMASKEITDFSIFQMQPWLDVKEGGSAVVGIADSPQKARLFATEFSNRLKNIRKNMSPRLFSVDEIIKAVRDNNMEKPIILVDFSDSANAGAAGDNTDVLARILELNAQDIDTALIVTDTPAVAKAFEIGVGNTAVFDLGGTRDALRSKPVRITARVRSLHDGDFKLEGPSRGVTRHIGKCAVLSVANIDILVTQSMASTGDTGLYRHFGIEPTFYKLVMVKANTSFYASYNGICSKVMLTDTRCAATADLLGLPFKNLPGNFYPFSDIEDFDVNSHVLVK